jgi:hypothetical protein
MYKGDKKMAKSSINFERVDSGSFKHNARSKSESFYLLPKRHRLGNDISCSAEEANEILREFLSEASENYREHFGQKLQAKKYIWEAEVNLNHNHTKEDLEKLIIAIERETGFRIIQSAIHRDEGHINERGVPIYNLHAHLSFFTLDMITGQQLYRRQITKKQKEKQPDLKPMNRTRMSKLQDIAAEVLGMERGKRGSKAKRLNHWAFREKKELQNEIKRLENENEKLEDLAYTGKTFDYVNDLDQWEIGRETYKTLYEQGKQKNEEFEELIKKLGYENLQEAKEEVQRRIDEACEVDIDIDELMKELTSAPAPAPTMMR